MKPPIRLRDDPSLSSQLRADLELSARSAPPYDVAKGLAELRGALDAAGAVGVNPTDPVATATSGIRTVTRHAALSQAKLVPWVLKAGLTALAGVIAVSLGIMGAPHLFRSSPPSAERQPAPAVPQALEPQTPETRGATADPQVTQEASHAQRLPRTESASRREIAQLVRIRALLTRDPAAAYRLAQASHHEFPEGALREEREGLSVMALWRLGQTERARAQTARFVARYPQSPLRERLERMLAVESAH